MPPLAGLSANEGEDAIREMIMKSCERTVFDMYPDQANAETQRGRARQLIEKGLTTLRGQYG